MSTASDPWGRVAEDGTVYVRTADGERQVGSWQAGSPDEALAFFKRKFETLETEVSLLEQRLASTDLSPGAGQVDDRAPDQRRSRTRMPSATWTGCWAGCEKLTGLAGRRREEHKAAREQARSEALEDQGADRRRGRATSRPRPPTGRSAASGCASSWRSGRPRRAATGPRRRRCGSGFRRPATRSPSAARRTSPSLEEEREGIRAPQGGPGPARPRRCPAQPTGARRRPPTGS